jgi:hypothetical protein
MVTLGTPFKTADGHAELAARYNNLSQRHRTLLLLIDGRRTLDEVLALGRRAGVPSSLIDDLVALGLVEVPMIGSRAPRDTVAMAPPVRLDALAAWQAGMPPAPPPPAPAALPPRADPADLTQVFDEEPEDPHERATEQVPLESAMVDLDLDAGPISGPEPTGAWDTCDGGPSSGGLSVYGAALVASVPGGRPTTAPAAASRHEARMARARGLLLQALHEDGAARQSMTMLRVRRARSVEDMLAVAVELAERLGRQGDLFDGLALVQQAQRLLRPLRDPSKGGGT